MKILLVSPHQSLQSKMHQTLSLRKFIVDLATDGEEAWALLQTFVYDLLVLEAIMPMPKLDGLQLCHRLRKVGNPVPILLLVEKSKGKLCIEGLNSGADACLTKPFQDSELLAHIHTLSRRVVHRASYLLNWGPVSLNPTACSVTCHGQPLKLNRKEYQIIELFLSHPRRMFPRQEIGDRLWTLDEELPTDATIKSHIRSIRRKLEQAGIQDMIQTHYGQGYCLNPAYDLVSKASSQVPPTSEAMMDNITANIWQELMTANARLQQEIEQRREAESIPPFLMGEYQEFGREYFKGLNVAFFEAYLRDRSEFLPYLSSSYAEAISQDKPMSLAIIQTLTSEELETAYGKQPPVAIIPLTVESPISQREDTILNEIRQTKVLKVAMRRDAPPFGYIDKQQRWTGYCSDLAVRLQEHLADKLGLDLGIELVELPSTLENRFSLIQEDTVHLECGPNSIRQDLEGIAFSIPFWTTGTRFLTQKERQTEINPNLSLEGLQVGVLKNTTTEDFIQTNYPQAEIVYFDGTQGRAEAVQAVVEGRIDTFASDSILSLEEIARQNLPANNYLLQPKLPLTCDFYGLILPNNDPQWRATVNEFIAKLSTQKVMARWINPIYSADLNDLEYCLNR